MLGRACSGEHDYKFPARGCSGDHHESLEKVKVRIDDKGTTAMVYEMELTGELDSLTRYVASLEKKETPDEPRNRI